MVDCLIRSLSLQDGECYKGVQLQDAGERERYPRSEGLQTLSAARSGWKGGGEDGESRGDDGGGRPS